MADVLVRNLDEKTLDRLRTRAERHGRSVQAELREIVQQAVRSEDKSPIQLAAEIRKRLSGRIHSDSTAMIARDRRR